MPNQQTGKVILATGLVILVVAVVVMGIALFTQSRIKSPVARNLAPKSTDQQQGQPSQNKNQHSGQKKELKCPADWQTYAHDAIGIQFCYPSSWGTPVTEPISSITRLEGLKKDADNDEHNMYSHALFINFSKEPGSGSSKIHLKLFNDKYKGEYYPNAYAYDEGPMDNIPALKASQNICDYHVNFTKPWDMQGSMAEFWNECQDGIKVSLIEHDQYFQQMLYS